jgi:hypothetical protein
MMARQECVDYGHDLTFLKMVGSSDPYAATCGRCGRHYEIRAVDPVSPHPFVAEQPARNACLLFTGPDRVCSRGPSDPIHSRQATQ